nr:PREDICTED: aminopeptidase N [Apteryx mantelli mantelli]
MYIFTGNSTVVFICEEPTDIILIHSNKLNYTMQGNFHTSLQAKPGLGQSVSCSPGACAELRKALYPSGRTSLCLLVPASTTTTTATTTTTTAAPDNLWNRWRLPTTLKPQSYEVTLRPFLKPNENQMYIFTGNSTVVFICEEPTDIILIHSNKLNYTMQGNFHTSLQAVDGSSPPAITKTWLETTTQYLVVQLGAQLQKGHYYKLFSIFTGELADDLAGFYRSEYMDGTETKVVATTQMQAADARKAFPCFDEPAMKANFTVTIIHPTDHKAISNMPPKSTQQQQIDGESWNVTEFLTTPKMSTYLLAFIVSQFDSIESTSGNVLRCSRSPTMGAGFFISKSVGIVAIVLALGAVATIIALSVVYAQEKNKPQSYEVTLRPFLKPNENQMYIFTGNSTVVFICEEPTDIILIHSNKLNYTMQGNFHTSLQAVDGSSPAKYLGVTVALNTTRFLSKETEYMPWQAALNSLAYFELMFDRSEVFGAMTAVNKHGVSLPGSIDRIMDRWTLQMGFPVVTVNTLDGSISQKHFLLDPTSKVDRPSSFNTAPTDRLPPADQVGLPDFNAGAMENWGLVTYRENSLLYDNVYSSIGNKERVVTVIAHELAHQLEQFKADNQDVGFGSGTRALEQALERTRANINWVNENKQAVLAWFQGETGSS